MLPHPAIPWLIHTDLTAVNGHWTKMSPRNHSIPIAEPQHHIINPTNTGRALNDSIENRLHVRGRAADDCEHLSGRRLVLQASRNSLAVASSRCKDWASARRSSAFVWACLAGDVFTTARRGFALVFLEPFLVGVAIYPKRPKQSCWSGERL